jgi:hypothetical protein
LIEGCARWQAAGLGRLKRHARALSRHWQNAAMVRRYPLVPRWVLWFTVGALVLRAGMPWLAATAAQLRGVPVAQICSVNGVAPAHEPAWASQALENGHQDTDQAGDGSHPAAIHDQDRCALTSLGALAVPGTVVHIQTRCPCDNTLAAAELEFSIHDACAAWAAQRKQGPPARA